jgi:hypothetical protein
LRKVESHTERLRVCMEGYRLKGLQDLMGLRDMED